MNCNEYENLITDYLENSLSSSEYAEVESHLAECESCREQAENEKTLMEQLSKISIEQCPDEIIDRVMKSIPKSEVSLKERISSWLRSVHLSRYGAASLAGSLAIILFVLFINIPRNQRQTIENAEYSQEEIRQAEVEVKLALAYFAVYSRKTETALQKINLYEPVVKPVEGELKKALGKIPFI